MKCKWREYLSYIIINNQCHFVIITEISPRGEIGLLCFCRSPQNTMRTFNSTAHPGGNILRGSLRCARDASFTTRTNWEISQLSCNISVSYAPFGYNIICPTRAPERPPRRVRITVLPDKQRWPIFALHGLAVLARQCKALLFVFELVC